MTFKTILYRNGFTLLEMLVVLVLTSLISTLLFESVTYVLQLRSRFLDQLNDAQHGALQEHWFRSTTAGIITDYENGEHLFKGNQREFSGLTLAALDMEVLGVPTPFAWQIQYADGITTLNYRNSQGESWSVAHWLGDSGEFQYLSIDGEWHNQWPPQFGLETVQIPRLISLQGQRRQMPFIWIVKLSDADYNRYDHRLYD